MYSSRKRVSRILAVGDSPDDKIMRMTLGHGYTCVAGSEGEHHRFQIFCEQLIQSLRDADLDLSDVSPSELAFFLDRTDKEP